MTVTKQKPPVRRQPRESGAMERHIQTILISLIVGAIGFSASYFFNDRSDKAVLVTQMTQLTIQVQEMRAEIRHMQQQMIPKDMYNDHESRIRSLEQRSESVGRVFKSSK